MSPVVVEWMLKGKGWRPDKRVNSTKRLMTIGSILSFYNCDATVWGSGLISSNAFVNMNKRKFRKLDVRAVRGPISRDALLSFGYNCPDVYGDPAILMPLIYRPDVTKEKDTIAVILHHASSPQVVLEDAKRIKQIDIKTGDYKSFINELVSVGKVISSSLHGIILAESYGIPAVYYYPLINPVSPLKFYDWYYSTGRYSVKVARSIGEAIEMTPMELPDLSSMRNDLIKSFPYDLWS